MLHLTMDGCGILWLNNRGRVKKDSESMFNLSPVIIIVIAQLYNVQEMM